MTPRPLVFFSEDRLLRDRDGRIASIDARLAAGGWARGLTDLDGAAFAARVGGRPSGVASAHVVRGRVVELPCYVGGRGLLVALPRLVVAVLKAVRSSTAVAVRLPGVVGTLAVVAAVLTRRKVAAELVGDVGDVLRSGVGGRTGAALAGPASAITRWAVRRASWVRYVTTHTLQEQYPAPAAVTYAFSDVILEEADFGEAPKEFPGTPVVLAVGSHEQRYKGHDVLIRAIAALSDDLPDLQCMILGEGRFQPELRGLASDLDVADRVCFRGHLSSRDDVQEAMDRSWVLAMPSRTEGLPRALVEAMARALPCVGSQVGGIPELLEPEWLVRPDDDEALARAIRRLCTDAGTRERQSRRNRAHASSLHHSAAADRARWADLVRSLSRGRRAS